jgi:hypothetical protein
MHPSEEAKVSDALGLAGFYFTLIGFVSGLFFTRLDGWYGAVRAFHGKLTAFTRREQYEDAEPERQGLVASAPWSSFAVVGVLLTLLMVLAFLVPVQDSPVNPWLFIYAPLIVTVGSLPPRGHT